MKTNRFLVLVATLIAVASDGRAQSYAIDWFSIDGGGGTSTGGVYSVSGTIGQPDAGEPMTGGSFSLVGGFWGLVAAVQTPGAPLLTVSRNPATGAVTVSWPKPADGWLLDQASGLGAVPAATSWSQVGFPYTTNATQISITVPSPAGNKLYRLRKP